VDEQGTERWELFKETESQRKDNQRETLQYIELEEDNPNIMRTNAIENSQELVEYAEGLLLKRKYPHLNLQQCHKILKAF